MSKNEPNLVEQHTHTEILPESFLERSLSFENTSWESCFVGCENAVQNNLWSPTWGEILKNLFSKGRDNLFFNSLPEEQYGTYFKKASVLLEEAAKVDSNFYYELACFIKEARRGYQDSKKFQAYLDVAVSSNNSEAIGFKAWTLYFGISIEKDPSLAHQLLERIEDKANLSFLFVSAYIALVEGREDEFEEKMRQIIDRKDTTKGFYTSALERFGDFVISRGNLEEGLAYITEAAQLNNPYALYALGWRTVQGHDLEKNESLGLDYLVRSYNLGSSQAADYLGNYYFNVNNLELAEEWYRKGVQGNHYDAFLNLARVYIFHKEKSEPQWEEAVTLLKEASEANHTASIVELAYLYKNGNGVEQDYDTYLSYLQKAVALKDGYAMYLLALAYERGEIEEAPDYEKAYDLLKESAYQGDIYGMEAYGHYCRIGLGGEPNPEEAVTFFNQSIAQGSAYAKVELAICYERGFGVEQNREQAFNLVTAAAEQEYPYALHKLAEYYEYGFHVETDEAKAFEWYKKAAEYDHPMYWYNLARCYKYGTGTEVNEAEAIHYFSKAAETGYGEAEVEMALCYESGFGVDKNPHQAFEYMEKAAMKNISFAQYKLGIYYYYEFPEYDLEKAKEWFIRASETDYAYADLYLGDIYLYYSQNNDEAKAYYHYKKAAANDCYSEGLGVCYYYGYGTESDEQEAFKAFLKGAQANYTKAKYYLARCYKDGEGVTANLQEAYKWMEEASEAEYAPAQYELAMMYSKGQGTVTDLEKSVSLLRAAADSDYSHAQYELGNCYLVGKGLEEDEQLAIQWFEKAADNGNEKAKKILGRKN